MLQLAWFLQNKIEIWVTNKSSNPLIVIYVKYEDSSVWSINQMNCRRIWRPFGLISLLQHTLVFEFLPFYCLPLCPMLVSAFFSPVCLLAVAEVLHLMAISQLWHFSLVLLALQMLPEVRLLLGSTVAHGAVKLSAGSDTHGQVSGDALPWSGVVVRPWREMSDRRKEGTIS